MHVLVFRLRWTFLELLESDWTWISGRSKFQGRSKGCRYTYTEHCCKSRSIAVEFEHVRLTVHVWINRLKMKKAIRAPQERESFSYWKKMKRERVGGFSWGRRWGSKRVEGRNAITSRTHVPLSSLGRRKDEADDTSFFGGNLSRRENILSTLSTQCRLFSTATSQCKK